MTCNMLYMWTVHRTDLRTGWFNDFHRNDAIWLCQIMLLFWEIFVVCRNYWEELKCKKKSPFTSWMDEYGNVIKTYFIEAYLICIFFQNSTTKDRVSCDVIIYL